MEKVRKEPFNLEYSKLEKYPVKSFPKGGYIKIIINDEEYEQNDINSLYNDKKDILKNIMYNGNKNFEKANNIKNNIYNKFKNNEFLNNSNIINNYISKKLYSKNEDKSINYSYKDISEDINEKIELHNNDNNNKINEIYQEVPIYNARPINKSKSYFKETNPLNNNSNNFLTLINIKTNNYKKNVNSFNQTNRIYNNFNGKNNKSFKHKIYCGFKNNGKKYLLNNSLENNSFESISIDDLINKVNFNGDKRDFPKYMKELKLKADITNIVQNMFKNEINCYDGLDKFLESYSKKKKILDVYKFLLERLIQINQNKINDNEINSFYEELYSSQH